MNEDMKLSEFGMDALREIGNIGGSHAANSLSRIINAPVRIISPKLEITTLDKFPEFVGEENADAVCISAHMTGSISGAILLFFPAKAVARFSDALSKDDFSAAREIGGAMLASFSKAVGDFFSLEAPPRINTTLLSGSVREIVSRVAAHFGSSSQKSVFLSTSFLLDSSEAACHLFMSLNGEDLQKIMSARAPTVSQDYGSFSEMLGVFEKLVNIEVKLDSYIRNSRVPMSAKRDFLRSPSQELSSDRLSRFILSVLASAGIGERIGVSSPRPLAYRFAVKDCNVCKVASNSGVNSCHTTSTALGRFFREALGIANEVKEVECRKGGAAACVHEVALEQIDVFSVLPEEKDLAVLGAISRGALDSEGVRKLTNLPGVEIVDSLRILSHYGIIDSSGERFFMTELGRIFMTFAQNAPGFAQDAAENWDDVSRLDAAPREIRSAAAAKAPWE